MMSTSGSEVAGRSIAFNMDCQRKDEGVMSASSLHAGTIQSMTTGALQADTAHIMVPADLLDYHYVRPHVPLTPETKEPINKELLMKMQKGVTLINTTRPEVMHEGETLEVLRARSDFSYLFEVAQECRGCQGACR